VLNISKETRNILKNFASINSNLLVRPGSVLATRSPGKEIMVRAEVREDFPREFGIWDLNLFLGTIGLFDDPTFEFGDAAVTLSEGTSTVGYTYADSSMLDFPKSDSAVKMQTIVVSFALPLGTLHELNKAAAVLSLPDLSIQSDGDGKISAVLTNSKDTSSNKYSIVLCVDCAAATFKLNFDMGKIKLLAGDYQVDISHIKHAKGESWVGQFSLKVAAPDPAVVPALPKTSLTYWITLKNDSVYEVTV